MGEAATTEEALDVETLFERAEEDYLCKYHDLSIGSLEMHRRCFSSVHGRPHHLIHSVASMFPAIPILKAHLTYLFKQAERAIDSTATRPEDFPEHYATEAVSEKARVVAEKAGRHLRQVGRVRRQPSLSKVSLTILLDLAES